MTFRSKATTHVGMVRKLNEDAYTERTDIGVWVVADGMGGHEAGEVASGTVTEYIKALAPGEGFPEKLDAVKQCVLDANSHLVGRSTAYDTKRVPGSTVAVLIISGEQGAVVWAGDSRIYRRREGVVTQITRDHSHVQDLIEQGVIKESEAESHPLSNVITRAVGIGDPLELETRLVNVRSTDQFLLCSDGLSRLASNEEIGAMMANRDSEEVTRSLLHAALTKGAPDNVTLIYVKNYPDDATFSNEDVPLIGDA